MSVPLLYDRFTLAKAMETWLGSTGEALGWSAARTSYDEPVIDTMLAYPVTDLAQATDIGKLRALALYFAWCAAAGATAGRVDISGETGGMRFSQMHEHAVKMKEAAEYAAVAYLPVPAGSGGVVTVTEIVNRDNPWATPPSRLGGWD